MKKTLKYTAVLLAIVVVLTIAYCILYVDSATYTIVSISDGCAIGTSPEGFRAAYSSAEYQIGDTVTTYIGFNPFGASDDILFRFDQH